MKLELILRLLDNDELSPEQVNDVKDFLDDYVERNQVYYSVQFIPDVSGVGHFEEIKYNYHSNSYFKWNSRALLGCFLFLFTFFCLFTSDVFLGLLLKE